MVKMNTETMALSLGNSVLNITRNDNVSKYCLTRGI